MLTKTQLFIDNLRHRDQYLHALRDRMRYFMDTASAYGPRVIDGAPEAVQLQSVDVPEVAAADLNIDVVTTAIRDKGCLIVRGFFSSHEVNTLRAYVDYAFALHNNDSRLGKYLRKRLDVSEVLRKTRSDVEEKRKVNPTYSDTLKTGRNLGQPFANNRSYLVAQTPIVSERILALYESRGLKALLAQYFGNDPCASIYKWVMRRSPPPDNAHDFHQDGAFMGDAIASLNTWVPLTDCGPGQGAHGLDIVPARLMRSFAKGTGILDWSITPQAVVDQFGEEAIVSPVFKRGDLFLFDHLLVHRTQSMPTHTEQRYALETWFFDSQNFPKNQIPLKW